MPSEAAAVHRSVCAGCGSEVAASFGACPACGRLVHAERLKTLATQAQAAEIAGELRRALELWQEALGLLPPAST